MKIGFDAKRLFNNYTGLGNYARTLVKNYAQVSTNSINLYATHSNKNPETDYFYNSKNVTIHIAKAFLKSLWRSCGIVKQLKKDEIAIYHGLSNELPFGIKKSGIKSIVTIHDLIFKIYPKTYPFFDRLIYDVKFKYACKTANKIIAISEQTKKDIIRFYKIPESKIEVVYQSCNELFFNENKQDKSVLNNFSIPEKYNLYVGTVNERKNLKSIIKAYSLLESSTLIPLVIIGKGGKYKQECIQLIKKFNLINYFIWVDNLERMEDLQCVYQNANCFIYPSFYEGFGIPIIEAMLSKTPVITSNISCLPEATGGNAIHINPNTPQEIADAITKLATDNSFREATVNNAFDYASSLFSSDKTAAKLDKVYNTINF